MGLDQRGEKIIHALLGVREAEKLLGTYTGHVEDGKIVGGPLIHADGRVRTTWRPGKTAGRWGSGSAEHAEHPPKKLRAMFVPAPGNVFVAADMSAVELRMIALLAGDEILIEAFKAFDEKRGPDVHIFNACGLFRCQPEDVTDEIRNFVKRFVYALNYDAQPPTIYQTLSLLRDDKLRPLFPASDAARGRADLQRMVEAAPSDSRLEEAAHPELARSGLHRDGVPQAASGFLSGGECDRNGKLSDSGSLSRPAERRHPGRGLDVPVQLREAPWAQHQRARSDRGGVR